MKRYLKKTNIGINGSVAVGGLEWRSVPVVADSRSEELTDGQGTPFLPPSAANHPAGMSYKSCVGSYLEVLRSKQTVVVPPQSTLFSLLEAVKIA